MAQPFMAQPVTAQPGTMPVAQPAGMAMVQPGAQIQAFVFTAPSVGVALEDDPSTGKVRVTSIVAGSAAESQGVPTGLAILDVNGTPVEGMQKEAVQALMIKATRPL